jgi:hypothetical protein
MDAVKKWLLLAFIAAGVGTLGYVDWQETLPEDATYIHIGDPILHHTWTCKDGGTGCTVTTQRNCATSTTTCTITVGSTTGASVAVVCVQIGGSTGSLSSVTGGGTWVVDASSRGTDATLNEAVQCAHNLNMTAATTSVVCNWSAGFNGNECQYFNFSGTGSSFTFDTANSVDDTTACTSCAGVGLTLTTSNNYILIQSQNGATASAINQSYTAVFVNGDGFAYKINQTAAGTTPNWTQTSSRMVGAAIAIYEVTGGAVAGFNKRQKLEKLGI